MNVRTIIASKKTIFDAGKWSKGTMPKSAFPLSKSGSKSYRYGNRRWRTVTFEASGLKCRLLINYHPTLLQYQAMLGVEAGGDTKVLVSLELHPTHKPWHVHACCGSLSDIPAGIKRGSWVRNLNGHNNQTPCPQTDDSAFAVAAKFFRLDKTVIGGLL